MNILITGLHGFVGRNLVAQLRPEHRIYGLARTQVDMPGVEKIYTWDSLHNGSLPDVDAIIHLAGKAHDTKNQAKAEVYFKVNRDLTIALYDYFVKSKAQKFIFFSTVKAVADVLGTRVLTEEADAQPKGPYGESKREAEAYILEHPSPYKEVYVLRPCMMHGEGNKGNLNLLYKVVSKGVPWPLGAFSNSRSFASIDNVCLIVLDLLDKHIPSGVYNIADDTPLSTNQLIGIICGVMGKKSRIWNMSPSMIRMLARMGDVLHLPLNTQRLAKLTESYVVSNNKIKQALGIDSLPVDSKAGLEKTIKSFRAY